MYAFFATQVLKIEYYYSLICSFQKGRKNSILWSPQFSFTVC